MEPSAPAGRPCRSAPCVVYSRQPGGDVVPNTSSQHSHRPEQQPALEALGEDVARIEPVLCHQQLTNLPHTRNHHSTPLRTNGIHGQRASSATDSARNSIQHAASPPVVLKHSLFCKPASAPQQALSSCGSSAAPCPCMCGLLQRSPGWPPCCHRLHCPCLLPCVCPCCCRPQLRPPPTLPPPLPPPHDDPCHARCCLRHPHLLPLLSRLLLRPGPLPGRSWVCQQHHQQPRFQLVH